MYRTRDINYNQIIFNYSLTVSQKVVKFINFFFHREEDISLTITSEILKHRVKKKKKDEISDCKLRYLYRLLIIVAVVYLDFRVSKSYSNSKALYHIRAVQHNNITHKIIRGCICYIMNTARAHIHFLR